MDMTIGKFAAAGGVGVETVRFYQRKGLLKTPKRLEGGRRYGSEDLRQLQFIRQAQTAGFTLEEIRELLELDAGDDRARVREAATIRLAALNARILELNRTREALERLVAECSSGKSGPCPILKSFGL
ncbi:MerR family transcriptional regulator [Ciceribacter thiooxidans]|uniref:MerR family transcriptional regulator n=1 Tax=Ciceribacter thiooxidans TaxID=1969821 RepID=A0ABV7I909_9HYPH|nr:MerR family transcriptional regulator [Ciceribacter thiooxidans]MDI6835981.1 MerR family transcriptional regulator [Rhizobiaceae bacterium]